MQEVRRSDGELCGFVAAQGSRWQALTVFGALLGEHGAEGEAERHVREGGLAALADCWTLIDGHTGDQELVRIQQASPTEVTVVLGYYSLPGVPTVTIPTRDLQDGRWRLEPGAPPLT